MLPRGEGRPFLLEMRPDSTLATLQDKIFIACAIPVSRQILFYQDKCINAIYSRDTKLLDMKDIRNITKASAVFVFDNNEMANNPLGNSALFPSSSSQPNLMPVLQPQSKLYVRCTKQPNHNLDDPDDQVTDLIFNVKCHNCNDVHRSQDRLSCLHFSARSLPQRCPKCNKNVNHEVVICCGRTGCGNSGLHDQSVLWHVFRDNTETLMVKFSACDHTMPLRPKKSGNSSTSFNSDFESLLLTSLDQTLVENTGPEKACHGDYVFQCPRCKGQKFSYAAFNTSSVVDPRLKEHLRMIVAQKKMFRASYNSPETVTLQRSVYEQECAEFYRQPFRCPTCKRSIDTDVLAANGTTHGTCSHPKCPKFCLMCLKTEPEVEGGNLFLHNLDSGLNPRQCPLFLETHPLFSSDHLQAWKDFLHWRTVGHIYEYAHRMKAVDTIRSIDSLKPYTKDFDFWTKLLDKVQPCCVLPIPPVGPKS